MDNSGKDNKAAETKALTRRTFAKIASVGIMSIALPSFPRTAIAQEGSGQRQFIDSLNRSVSVANVIESVTPIGIHAQTLMTTLCPEGLASLATGINDDAADYKDAGIGDLTNLPKTGGIVSPATEDVAIDEIEIISPELILDVGLPRDGLASELDALQAETGIPVVFLDISFGKLSQAYRTLGELLGYQSRAEDLADYIDRANDRVRAFAASSTTSNKVFYAPRENGLTVRSGIEVQIDALAFSGATPVTAPYDYVRKTVDFNILKASETDFVIFDDTNCLDSFLSGEGEAANIWKDVTAISQGKYAVSPALMHSWFGSAVLVQTLGILWISSILWPTERSVDITSEARSFYSLFYGLIWAEDAFADLAGDRSEEGFTNGK